jgi:hypothetical protein
VWNFIRSWACIRRWDRFYEGGPVIRIGGLGHGFVGVLYCTSAFEQLVMYIQNFLWRIALEIEVALTTFSQYFVISVFSIPVTRYSLILLLSAGDLILQRI